MIITSKTWRSSLDHILEILLLVLVIIHHLLIESLNIGEHINLLWNTTSRSSLRSQDFTLMGYIN